MKVLFDTNIWLDIILQREGFYIPSRCIYLGCIDDGTEILVAATSLKDIFYLACKNSNREIAFDAVKGIMETACVCAVDEPICRKALDLDASDFEDGMIAACAVAECADLIITRDASAFKDAGIPCLTSEEFLALQGWSETSL